MKLEFPRQNYNNSDMETKKVREIEKSSWNAIC